MSIQQGIIDALEDAGIDYDVENYKPEKTFKDNGIDSLDVMSLFLVIEEKYAVKFSQKEVDSIFTPSDIAKILEEKIS